MKNSTYYCVSNLLCHLVSPAVEPFLAKTIDSVKDLVKLNAYDTEWAGNSGWHTGGAFNFK